MGVSTTNISLSLLCHIASHHWAVAQGVWGGKTMIKDQRQGEKLGGAAIIQTRDDADLGLWLSKPWKILKTYKYMHLNLAVIGSSG